MDRQQRRNVNRINEEASRLLTGWDADDVCTYDRDQWDVIPWKRFHATLYRYEIVRHSDHCVIEISPAYDHSLKVYVSDKWEPFIQTMREAIWSLVDPNRLSLPYRTTGVAYIARSGKPERCRLWTIPLYDQDLFTPRA